MCASRNKEDFEASLRSPCVSFDNALRYTWVTLFGIARGEGSCFSCVPFSECLCMSVCGLQLIPLLLVNDHEHGGYHLDDNEFGVLAITAAVCEFLFQVGSLGSCSFCSSLSLSLIVICLRSFFIPGLQGF